jgi:hypothetical protein
MRKSLVLASLLVLVCSAAAFAGVPAPDRSSCAISGSQLNPCQWRFRAQGDADQLTLCITLNDAFDTPVASCSTSATLTGSPVCDCEGLVRTGFTDAGGVVCFAYHCIGGRGTATINVTAHCVGDIGICSPSFEFTSPDLNGSCNNTPGPGSGGNVDVVDIGIWAGGLPPAYLQASDYNCDGTVNVSDLGFLAGGLTTSCSNCP